jgi:hypothetical protein
MSNPRQWFCVQLALETPNEHVPDSNFISER